MMNEPKSPAVIFITGRPGVGKTTVSQAILQVLGLPVDHHIGIDQAHHALCDPRRPSARYSYRDDGVLVLHDREGLMREGLLWVADRIRRHAGRRPLCVEFSHYGLEGAWDHFDEGTLSESVTFEVHAPEPLASERNRRRPPIERVPDEYMRLAFATPRPAASSVLADRDIIHIHNDELVSLPVLHSLVRQALTRVHLPGPPDDERCDGERPPCPGTRV